MKTKWNALLGVGLCAAVLSVATPARSDDEPVRAAEFRKQANAAADARDWKTCRDKASEAWKITKSPITAGTLGICETELGDFVAGAEHLDYALRLDDVAARRELVSKALEKAKKSVATVNVSTTPAGARVRVGSHDYGDAHVVVYLAPGSGLVTAQKDGFDAKSLPIEAKAGATVPLAIDLSPTSLPGPSRPLWPAILLGGLGVVGLGVGAGMAIAANGKAADAEAAATSLGTTCPPTPTSGPCADAVADADDRDLFSNVSMATLLTGGILAAGSVGLFVWAATGSSKPKQDASWSVVPVITSETAGVTIFGSF